MKVWEFPSSSSPTIYRTQIGDNGLLSCTCPGWTVKKLGKVRSCKHTKKVIADEGLIVTVRDDQQFVLTSGGVVLTEKIAETLADQAEHMEPPKPAALNVPGGFISPMLASKMPEGKTADSFNSEDWIAEEKFDGHRLIIRVAEEVHPGKHLTRPDMIVKTVGAWSRLGNIRTLPKHIHELMLEMPVGVYDGELIVPGQHSYDVTEGQNSGTEVLVLFDMLEALNDSVMGEPFGTRRQMLEIAYGAITDGQTWLRLARQFKPSVAAVQDIWDGGGEGTIIKNVRSKYHPGWRTPDWIKVKAVLAATLTVIGFEAGKNGPYSVVRLRDDAGIETTVKTLDNKTMRQITANPNEFIGKRLVISYQEKMPSGKYRHPMWDHEAGVGE